MISYTSITAPDWITFDTSAALNTCCFLFTQKVTRFLQVKWPLKWSNLNDIELLRLAGARGRVKANQAVIQDSPGHLQSIPAQSQLKLAGSVEGHQFFYKLNAILKSKQSQRGLHWFNGSSRQERPVKSARTRGGQVSLMHGVVFVDVVWHQDLAVQQDSEQTACFSSWYQMKTKCVKRLQAWIVFDVCVCLCHFCHNKVQ